MSLALLFKVTLALLAMTAIGTAIGLFAARVARQLDAELADEASHNELDGWP